MKIYFFRLKDRLSKDSYKDNLHFRKVIEYAPLIISAITVAVIAFLFSEIFFYFESNIHRFYLKNRWYNNLIVTVFSIFFSWLIPYLYSKNSMGSGVPQMLVANDLDADKNISKIKYLIGIRTIVFKIIASIIAIFGGAAVGQEGPMLQISSGIFYSVGYKFKSFYEHLNLHMLVMIGGGAGMATAFNTPLGGIAYALEELSKDHFNKIKSNVIFSVLVAGIAIQAMQGSYLYLGFPKLEQITYKTYFYVVIVSVLISFFGILFSFVLKRIYFLRNNLSFKQSVLINFLIGIIFWSIAQYVSPNILGAGKYQIINILFNNKHADLLQVSLRVLGPLLMTLAGVAGGLFAPSLTIGVVFASFINSIFHFSSSNLLSMIGMISFMTAFLRIPFTSFILVLEMTDRRYALVPMMLSAIISNGITKIFSPESFYEFLKKKILKENT